ncbi:MAG: thioredoxin domain-containing protein [Anaerolineae bacterium]|nr:thioredoxin domain-containing protein [Anaerolineae bacterium]
MDVVENNPPEKPIQPPEPVYIEQQAPSAEPPAAPSVMIIPREAFNYLIIAVIFGVVGGFVGYMFASSRVADNQALIDEAVAAIISAQEESLSAIAVPPSLDNPDSRFTVRADETRFQGPEDAPVVIVEFSDFNCTYCNRFANETLNPLLTNYEGKVRFTYRDYPILAESSLTAALAGHCAAEQGNFWDYHTMLFENRGEFAREQLIGYAESIGLDADSFTTCLDEERYLDTVVADYRDGEGLGIRGTPAFFINGRPISGAQPYEVFAGIIDEELAAAANSETTENESVPS